MAEQKKSYTVPPPDSENIEQPLMVVSTKNWIALFAILFLVTLSVLWLIFGSIPVVVHGKAFFWQKDTEKVIYGALPVDTGQKVREKSPVLMDVSLQQAKIQGEVIKNLGPMNLEELKKNIPSPTLASFLMGNNQAVVLIKVQPLKPETLGSLPSESTGEISIRIESLKPIQYVVPSW